MKSKEEINEIGNEILAKTVELCKANPAQANHIAEMVAKAVAYSTYEFYGVTFSDVIAKDFDMTVNEFYRSIMTRVIEGEEELNFF